MLVDFDEDDDIYSFCFVYDDDYFVSIEFLGIGVFRESLDKIFLYLDFLCGEVILEKDENIFLRSGFWDDGCDLSEIGNEGLVNFE